MSLALKETMAPEYGTKTDVHRLLEVTYTRIADAIRDGRLAIYLIDGKIQINISEAMEVFGKRDLFL